MRRRGSSRVIQLAVSSQCGFCKRTHPRNDNFAVNRIDNSSNICFLLFDILLISTLSLFLKLAYDRNLLLLFLYNIENLRLVLHQYHLLFLRQFLTFIGKISEGGSLNHL